MITSSVLRLIVLVLIALPCVVPASRPALELPVFQASKEDAFRANNLGVALLEQFKNKDAADEFRRALKLEPSLVLARINLGIALYNLPDLDAATRELKAAAELAPDSPQVHYMLGLIARAQNRAADAIGEFQKVLQIDSRDPAANINIGQLYMQQRKYAEALSVLRAAIASEPYSVTATYNLAIALTRSGVRQEGQTMMQRFQVLRSKGYGTTLGQNYLEQGRYAEAIASTGAEPALVDATTPDVRFVDATSTAMPARAETAKTSSPNPVGQSFKPADLNETTARQIAASLTGGVTLFDFDGDGNADLLEVGTHGISLYRNDRGKFVDVTAKSGLPQAFPGAVSGVAGDYDNDGRPDVLIVAYKRLVLYHNDGNGKFSDATASAGVPEYRYLAISAAFVDVDHDGDLDIFVAGFADLGAAAKGDPNRAMTFPGDFPGAPNLLLRNDGDGKFTDITAAAMIAGPSAHAIAIVPTDFDNHRDIDLLVVNYGAAPNVFSNQRDGSFRDVATEVGLNIVGRFTSVAVCDVNKDDYPDFFLGRADAPGLLALSDGNGHFGTAPAAASTQAAAAAQFLDYDNDGLVDLIVFCNQDCRVLRNLGTKWEDVSERVVSGEPIKSALAQVREIASADVDGDGDADLIVRTVSGEIKLAQNEGGNKNRSVRVLLSGKVSNRTAAGAKVEARAGSLRQKLESYAAIPAPAPSEISFGLGKRSGPDVVRVLWPAGILQAETEIAAANTGSPNAMLLKITELDRKPSSCPYLYAWNGERFEFVTDFMGGGEMGYWEGPGQHNHPDPVEYVRIRDDQLKERDGRYEIRVTNELEEVVYFDRLRLIAVEHPADTEVYPNEGMTEPPREFKLFTMRNARPPIAIDDHGHDVTDRIASLDRKYPDDFGLKKIRGYAETHSLTLKIGELKRARVLLALTGWTDYAFSSDNVAATQSGMSMKPPELQVKDAAGVWRTAIKDIGIPVGRPQTIVLDLTGKLNTGDAEARIVTNMRIYWDQILVDVSSPNLPLRVTELEPTMADLHWRGFSAEISRDGRQPFVYDYDRVSADSPWKLFPGRYTREGNVRRLLARSDDMFVISRPGDEISLSFDAMRLGPLRAGWRRTFLLYADGFSKEMDINSASPDQVLPLPFHGMSKYPYDYPESYPSTNRHRAYLERYNTRIVGAPISSIDLAHRSDISRARN